MSVEVVVLVEDTVVVGDDVAVGDAVTAGPVPEAFALDTVVCLLCATGWTCFFGLAFTFRWTLTAFRAGATPLAPELWLLAPVPTVAGLPETV